MGCFLGLSWVSICASISRSISVVRSMMVVIFFVGSWNRRAGIFKFNFFGVLGGVFV